MGMYSLLRTAIPALPEVIRPAPTEATTAPLAVIAPHTTAVVRRTVDMVDTAVGAATPRPRTATVEDLAGEAGITAAPVAASTVVAVEEAFMVEEVVVPTEEVTAKTGQPQLTCKTPPFGRRFSFALIPNCPLRAVSPAQTNRENSPAEI